jgi:hypothetical protein
VRFGATAAPPWCAVAAMTPEATIAVVVRPSAAMAALCRFQASELSTESPLGKSFFTNSATAAWRCARSSGVVWRYCLPLARLDCVMVMA